VADASTTKSELTEKLAEGVNKRGITLAYGDKQTVNGVEMIPVAFVTYGFGGIQDSAQYGDGGGGGGVAIPVGIYTEGAKGVQFKANTVTALAVGVLAIGALGWAIKLVVKAAR
jgi:hypothetical protein